MMYSHGWDYCLKEIDAVCEELGGGMVIKQQIAEELLQVMSYSQYQDPATTLEQVLEKLRELLSNDSYNWEEEQGMMYSHGWDDCLKEIDAICYELENL